MRLFDSDSKLILVWGVTVTAGWLLTFGLPRFGFGKKTIMLSWMVLMAFPVIQTALRVHRNDSNRLLNFWALIVALAMVQNILAPQNLQYYSYFHLWYIVGALGLYYTGSKVPGKSSAIYKTGSIFSIIGLAVITFIPYLAAPLAALTQGMPMIIDWLQLKNVI